MGGGIIGVIVLVLNFLIGGDVDTSQLPQIPGVQNSRELSPEEKAADDERGQFVKTVLGYTEDVWNEVYQKSGQNYPEPTLVLFRDAVQSGCGNAGAASGPFYCPADQQLYIDLSFYNDLETKFGASGDFAMAYVIAHEVGHHVQNLLGTSDKVRSSQQRSGEREGNRMSVKLELQADFYAGVWANHAQRMKRFLEPGDIEEALNAANAIGDDRLQEQSQGRVVPDAFTHGTSAQRMYWFKKGFQSGDIRQGNTFEDPNLN